MSIPDPGRASSFVAAIAGVGADGRASTMAPPFRAVDQHTGTVADRDKAIKERDDARAELDNMINLTTQVGMLGAYLKHAINDRDDYREQLDEMREKYHAAQCRMDELAAELRDLRGTS